MSSLPITCVKFSNCVAFGLIWTSILSFVVCYQTIENPIEKLIKGLPGSIDHLQRDGLDVYNSIDLNYTPKRFNEEIGEILDLFGITRNNKQAVESAFDEDTFPQPVPFFENRNVKRAEIENSKLAFGHNPERRSMMAEKWMGPQAAGLMSEPRSTNAFKWQYIILASGCTLAGVVGVMLAAGCWYNIHQKDKNKNLEAGLRGSEASRQGDAKLAQSAQMYHYQHQKQQMIASDRHSGVLHDEPASEEESEQDDAAEDFTVYECPGMAMGGEIEVKNPMFQPDPPSPTGSNEGAEKKN